MAGTYNDGRPIPPVDPENPIRVALRDLGFTPDDPTYSPVAILARWFEAGPEGARVFQLTAEQGVRLAAFVAGLLPVRPASPSETKNDANA